MYAREDPMPRLFYIWDYLDRHPQPRLVTEVPEEPDLDDCRLLAAFRRAT